MQTEGPAYKPYQGMIPWKGSAVVLTEEEAKTKWCPFAMTGYHGSGLNRISLPTGGSREQREIIHDTRCIASGCMMWVAMGAQPYATSPGTCGLIHVGQRL